jgi:capsular polysaccharide export protein
MVLNGMAEPRRILFLQGPPSIFWRELAIAFEAAGHATFKIHLNLGDVLWWLRRGGWHFRGRFSGWQKYLDRFVRDHGITDILYYADRQPYHIVAQAVAARHGIAAIAIENGYLRPDWITLERSGMGAFSHFPADPARIRILAAGLPDPDLAVRYRHGLVTEMTNEISYNLFARFYRFLYPLYRSGSYYNPFTEYVTGLIYHMTGAGRAADARRIVTERVASDRPYFVVALQLQADKQIHANSPFTHISEMIERVVASFAAHAPDDAVLLFKEHPHDNGVEKWHRITAAAATRHGVDARTQLICAGDLGRLLERARGCVIVNSTVGLYALRAGVPTKALGVAVYDMPGLTDQKPLDAFWRDPTPPDPELLRDFVRLLAATIQIKGSFYNRAGRHAAIREIVDRIASGRVNGAADEGYAVRLDAARKLGVRIVSEPVSASCQ